MNEIRWSLTALLLIFVTLKLTDQIEWSWIWVLAPFWIPISIGLLGWLLYAICLAMMSPEARRRYEARQALDNLSERLRR